MLSFQSGHGERNRREWLRVGGLSLLGLSAADLDRLRAQSPSDKPIARRRINSCVFVFLFGGPSHIDLWDMKPQVPVNVRGNFSPISTSVPGIQICEHLPQLAKRMDRLMLLRSMQHRMPVHGPACSELYTGREYFGPPTTDQATPQDWPSLNSLVTRYGQSEHGLPPSVVLPLYSQFVGQSKRIAGQSGGRMGDRYDPVVIACEPGKKDFQVEGFKLLPEVGASRIGGRRNLLRQLETVRPSATSEYGRAAKSYAKHVDMAYSMLHKPEFHRALDLERVKPAVRDAYGRTDFGQSLLMARQLVESGISLVTVNFDHPSKLDKRSPMWDTHHDNFAKLKDPLCPLFDQSFSAFIDDLDQRGLLETTLVVATGEFGRTPKVGQFSQNAMTLKTGRDHWPHAFTALLAGGGVPGGQFYGETSRDGGHVLDKPVSPADLSATILQHLGVDTSRRYWDEFQKVTRKVCEGTPVRFEC